MSNEWNMIDEEIFLKQPCVLWFSIENDQTILENKIITRIPIIVFDVLDLDMYIMFVCNIYVTISSIINCNRCFLCWLFWTKFWLYELFFFDAAAARNEEICKTICLDGLSFHSWFMMFPSWASVLHGILVGGFWDREL